MDDSPGSVPKCCDVGVAVQEEARDDLAEHLVVAEFGAHVDHPAREWAELLLRALRAIQHVKVEC